MPLGALVHIARLCQHCATSIIYLCPRREFDPHYFKNVFFFFLRALFRSKPCVHCEPLHYHFIQYRPTHKKLKSGSICTKVLDDRVK